MIEQDYTDFCLDRWKLLPTEAGNLLHIAIGFTGEILELLEASSRENILEELSDANFYLTIGATFYPCSDNYKPTEWPKTKAEREALLRSTANELLDYAKKGFIYEQAIPVFIIGEIIFLAQTQLQIYSELLGFDLADLTDYSRAKLLKRYPEGYSNQAAQLRADKQEP